LEGIVLVLNPNALQAYGRSFSQITLKNAHFLQSIGITKSYYYLIIERIPQEFNPPKAVLSLPVR